MLDSVTFAYAGNGEEMGRYCTGKALNILKLQCLLENIKAADPNLGVGHTITEKVYKKITG